VTDVQPTTQTPTGFQPSVTSKVDELTRDAITSRDAVRDALKNLRHERSELATRIKELVKEEEKLARIVRNLERMSENGEVSAPG